VGRDLTTREAFAIVTGTSSGIGEAVARCLLDHTWHVLGIARREAALTHESYEHISADLGDMASLSDGARAARIALLLERPGWQRVGLVNNAAHPGLLGPIERLDVAALPDVFATNVSAPIWLMGMVLRHVPRPVPVRIVNVSSRAAVRGYAGLGAYGASKAALRMASMVLAAEVDDPALAANARNVMILSYEPGTVDTAMQSNARSSSEETLPSIDLFRQLAVEGRLVPPAAPAGEIVEFLEGNADHVLTERRYGVS